MQLVGAVCLLLLEKTPVAAIHQENQEKDAESPEAKEGLSAVLRTRASAVSPDQLPPILSAAKGTAWGIYTSGRQNRCMCGK